MFKNVVSRLNTNCAKWDELINEYQDEEIISLTVADMDFKVAPEILGAVMEAALHGIYGYTNVSEKYKDLSISWMKKHYNFKVEKDWLIYCPRVIQCISLFIQNYTCIHDKIMVFTPLYNPIQNAIKINNRELVTSSLVLKDCSYYIDFRDFESKIQSGVKVFIMVSPHNPIGRVWKYEEIKKIIEICKKYNVLIISDEVHADFIWKEKFVSCGDFYDFYENIVICNSASKTFNIPGLEASNILIKDEKLRDLFKEWLNKAGIHNPNYFCIPAVEAAYEYGEEWLQLAKKEILENLEITRNFFRNNLDNFEVIDSDGTYMLWIDYRKTGIQEDDMKSILYIKSKVAFSMGSDFGEDGKGFFRINVATPKAQLSEALHRFEKNINGGKNEN